jgi:hypothetical protein
MGSVFQVATVNQKTPRMSHRYSLVFDGLTDVLTRVSANSNRTNLASATFTGIPQSELVKAQFSVTGGVSDIYNRLKQGALGGSTTADEAAALKNNLELSLLSVSVPSIEMETVEVARFHDTAKHISKFNTMGDMNVTFYDYIDGSASAILFLWQSLVGDKRTGAISYKSEYVLPNARLVEYGPKAPAQITEAILAQHIMVNIYPKTIELGEHSYESADIRKITATFSIDNIYPLYYKGQSGDPDYVAPGS